jgi:Holliday junction resolvase RusA-like endonuclease
MTECYPRKEAQYVSIFFSTKLVSVNALYRSIRGRNIKSKEARDFVRDAGAELEAQKPCCVPGPYALRIALSKATRIDCDNALKAMIDLLHMHGVVEGDGKRYLRRIEVWFSDNEKTMVQVISTRGE